MEHNNVNLWLNKKNRKRSNPRNKSRPSTFNYNYTKMSRVSVNFTNYFIFSRVETILENKEGTKEKFKSFGSNYFQEDKHLQSCNDSNGEDTVKDLHHEHLANHLVVHPVNDRNVAKLSKSVEALKLMKYGEEVKARLQKQFDQSNQAHQKMFHHEKVATHFSKQMIPIDIQEVENKKFLNKEKEVQTDKCEDSFDAASLFFDSIREARKHLESGSCNVPVWDFGMNVDINKLLRSPKRKSIYP